MPTTTRIGSRNTLSNRDQPGKQATSAVPLRIYPGPPGSRRVGGSRYRDRLLPGRSGGILSRRPARLLANAEGVYAEVLARLNRLQPAERGSFQPLVSELRRALDLALPPPA